MGLTFGPYDALLRSPIGTRLARAHARHPLWPPSPSAARQGPECGHDFPPGSRKWLLNRARCCAAACFAFDRILDSSPDLLFSMECCASTKQGSWAAQLHLGGSHLPKTEKISPAREKASSFGPTAPGPLRAPSGHPPSFFLDPRVVWAFWQFLWFAAIWGFGRSPRPLK